MIVQSRRKAQARNDLPRDLGLLFDTTPTRVAPHSECHRDDEVMLLFLRSVSLVGAFPVATQQGAATSGDVAYRAEVLRTSTVAHQSAAFRRVAGPAPGVSVSLAAPRGAPPRQETWPTGAEDCSLITPLFSRSASCSKVLLFSLEEFSQQSSQEKTWRTERHRVKNVAFVSLVQKSGSVFLKSWRLRVLA